MNDEHQRQLTRALDERARDLDGATLSRLRQARTHAMAAHPSQRTRWLQPAWLGAAGLAAVALVAVLLHPQLPSDGLEAMDPAGEAIEIATLDVDLEVIEDLDFYEWLSEQDIDELAQDGSA